jgi:dephospho-CoA kinase
MLLIGLTGSIGMGKSETAKMFVGLGVPVYDADAAVHALYDVGGKAVGPIEAAFPGVAKDGRIDRQALSKRVLGNSQALRLLESIIHPLVGLAQLEFLRKCEAEGKPMVVLDIPLLFEKGGKERVDFVVVVSAPKELQRERVLAREGMTAEKLDAILAQQTPDDVKRAGADFVVDTSQGLDHAFQQVKTIVAVLEGREGKAWAKHKR